MRLWWIHVIWEVKMDKGTKDLSSFILCLPGVSRSPVLPRAVVLRSLMELSTTKFRRAASPHSSPLLAASPVYPELPVIRRSHYGKSLHTIFKGLEQRVKLPEPYQGLGYFGSSLLSWFNLSSAIFFYREDFLSLHTE